MGGVDCTDMAQDKNQGNVGKFLSGWATNGLLSIQFQGVC
jgi:hypothetical protein